MTAPALSRRALIGGGLALPLLSGCSRGCTSLPPVLVDESRVIRTLAGLRPYRPQGFVVRSEDLGGGKTLVHNYGHGGGGITLSWGSSKLAADLLPKGYTGDAAVIGCGVMGLTTARLLQERGIKVTIYTDRMPPDTTSNVAGGQWHPAFVFDKAQASKAFTRQLHDAARYALDRFAMLAGDDYGVRWMMNHALSDTPLARDPVDEHLQGMLPEYRDLDPREHPFKFKYCRQWASPMVETPRFLRAMLRDVQLGGGQIRIVKKFETSEEIAALPEKALFNCTGLGAKALYKDDHLTPWRGQLVLLEPQAEVRYAINAESPNPDDKRKTDYSYMFSRSDAIIIGGTAQENDWRTESDPKDVAAILKRHKAIFSGFRCTA